MQPSNVCVIISNCSFMCKFKNNILFQILDSNTKCKEYSIQHISKSLKYTYNYYANNMKLNSTNIT